MMNADERFCDRCAAGVDSNEHHEKCVVPGMAIGGESAIRSGRLNDFQWRSANMHVGAEMLRGGVSIRVGNGVSYMGHNLTTDEADDLAKFIIDCGIAERAAALRGQEKEQ